MATRSAWRAWVRDLVAAPTRVLDEYLNADEDVAHAKRLARQRQRERQGQAAAAAAALKEQRGRKRASWRAIRRAIRLDGWWVPPGVEIDHYEIPRFSDDERGRWTD
jgi:uncharacterized protein YdaU (DUF1376 family)